MQALNFVLTAIICFVCLVSLLVLFHELGHYLTARLFGLKAEAFSVGMGREIAGITDRHGTRWKIAPIPIGGYVKFHGELHPGVGAEEEARHPQSFARLARWKRALIIFAGPFVNILITAIILASMFTIYGIPRIGSEIQEVVPGSTAERAGIVSGDHIVEWNDTAYDGSPRLVRYIKTHPEGEVDLTIKRDSATVRTRLPIARATMEDHFGNRTTIGQVGVMFARETKAVTNPIQLVTEATVETTDLFVFQMSTMWQIVKGERSLDEISGPLRLAKFSGEQFLSGWIALIYFAAILSIAVAFMNLLPLPGLDGGYLALYGIEALLQRDLSPKVITNALKVGYGLVAALAIFGLSNDLRVLMF